MTEKRAFWATYRYQVDISIDDVDGSVYALVTGADDSGDIGSTYSTTLNQYLASALGVMIVQDVAKDLKREGEL